MGFRWRDYLPPGLPASGREFLVLSQGAWSCQRAVRFADRLYIRTFHDGFHGAWPDEMLFDVASDPHEQADLASSEPSTVQWASGTLAEWTSQQLARSLAPEDPLDTIAREGGPYHVRGQLGAYVQRLRATGRGHWADVSWPGTRVDRLFDRAGQEPLHEVALQTEEHCEWNDHGDERARRQDTDAGPELACLGR